MNVARILDYKGRQVFAVRPDAPVRDVVALMAAQNIGTVLVTDSEASLLGIISERDVIRSLDEMGRSLLDRTATELMTRSVVTCTPETTILDALTLMPLHRIRHLPVVSDGKVIGFISIRDVLQVRLETVEEHFAALRRAEHEASRAKEAAELLNRAKSEFLANVSHELKTPLSAVLGFAELLTRETRGQLGAPKYVQYIREIEKSGRHLLEIVDNLLDLSRIEIRALETVDEALNISEIVMTCVNIVSERADHAGVVVQVEPVAALPALLADKRMVKQMLLNLLANAVKFTPKGGRISIRSAMDDGRIRVSVSDTGIGIAPENLAKIVQPFQQVDTSLARSYEGAGLGLALVTATMQAHGGNLVLESEIGTGTVATLCFPSSRTVGMTKNRPSDQPEAA